MDIIDIEIDIDESIMIWWIMRWTNKISWLKWNKCLGKSRRHIIEIERWNVTQIMSVVK
jgi:hypothetical protein